MALYHRDGADILRRADGIGRPAHLAHSSEFSDAVVILDLNILDAGVRAPPLVNEVNTESLLRTHRRARAPALPVLTGSFHIGSIFWRSRRRRTRDSTLVPTYFSDRSQYPRLGPARDRFPRAIHPALS